MLPDILALAVGQGHGNRSARLEHLEERTTHLGRIELEPGGAVSGRVVDERGVGLADCRLTLGSVEPSHRELEAARLFPVETSFPSTTSAADGRFRLTGVAAGVTRLWAHVAGRKAGYTPPFEVRAGQESTGVELVLERRIFIGVDGDAGAEFVESFRRACAGGENERRDYDNGARTAAMRECSRHFSDTFACHDDETPPTAGNVYRALSSAAIARRV